MNRRSQISLFLVLGIVLILIAGAIFHSKTSQKYANFEQGLEISNEYQSIKNWADFCLRQAVVDSIYIFGQQQGFYTQPDALLVTDVSEIAYYAFGEKKIIPSNEYFTSELASIVNQRILEQCTLFTIFEDQGYRMEFKMPSTDIHLNQDNLLFEIFFPMTIQKGKETSSISRFSFDLPFRIGHVLNVSGMLVDSVLESPSEIDLTLLSSLDIGVAVFEYDSCNRVYVLVDDQSRIQSTDEPYTHIFAIGFSEEYCREES